MSDDKDTRGYHISMLVILLWIAVWQVLLMRDMQQLRRDVESINAAPAEVQTEAQIRQEAFHRGAMDYLAGEPCPYEGDPVRTMQWLRGREYAESLGEQDIDR